MRPRTSRKTALRQFRCYNPPKKSWWIRDQSRTSRVSRNVSFPWSLLPRRGQHARESPELCSTATEISGLGLGRGRPAASGLTLARQFQNKPAPFKVSRSSAICLAEKRRPDREAACEISDPLHAVAAPARGGGSDPRRMTCGSAPPVSPHARLRRVSRASASRR